MEQLQRHHFMIPPNECDQRANRHRAGSVMHIEMKCRLCDT